MGKKIFIGSDHAGFQLKENVKVFLEKKKFKINDLGTFSEESCDYPDFAKKVAEKVAKEKNSFGILICGTGIGMSIAANKIKGIRAALVQDEFTAKKAREHNNANVLCLGARVIDSEKAKKILNIFLNTDFEGGRHSKRVEKIE